MHLTGVPQRSTPAGEICVSCVNIPKTYHDQNEQLLITEIFQPYLLPQTTTISPRSVAAIPDPRNPAISPRLCFFILTE